MGEGSACGKGLPLCNALRYPDSKRWGIELSRLLALVVVLALLGWGCGRPQARDRGPAAVPPRVLCVELVPAPARDGDWWRLPPGPGRVEVRVAAEGAERVNVWLVPTGTETWESRHLSEPTPIPATAGPWCGSTLMPS